MGIEPISTAMDSEFFAAVKEGFKLIPKFSERRKSEIQEETEKLRILESTFHKKAIEFTEASYADEILALAYEVKKQTEFIKNLYIIYAKELRGE